MEEIFVAGFIICIILFFIYDRRILKRIEAQKETINSQQALIEFLADKLKESECNYRS